MSLDLSQVKAWLKKFEYDKPVRDPANPDAPQQISTLTESIARVQEVYGLPPTGEPDAKTLKVMVIPRCGNPDAFPLREHIGGPTSSLYRWNLPANRTLLYYLDKQSLQGLDLPYSEVQAIIKDAYNAWEATSNIKYQQIDNPNDCHINMACGSGRPDGFDGPSNILAWAELPVTGSGRLQLKFDADEPWYGSMRQRGIALLNTACHEIGHLNGLTHSRITGALMAPTYSEAIPYPVQDDDIQRMLWRYGEPVIVVPPPGGGGGGTTPPQGAMIEAVRVKYAGVEGWHEYKTTKI